MPLYLSPIALHRRCYNLKPLYRTLKPDSHWKCYSCNYDYVVVRDGGTENSQQLAKLCGKTAQPTVRSTSNVIRLRMITDDSVSSGGFNITYQKGDCRPLHHPEQPAVSLHHLYISFTAKCGGTIIGPSGSIQSPQYPNSYPNGVTCEWYIQGPTGHYLHFNFSSFTLGNTDLTNCTSQDTLSFYDRDLSGKLCLPITASPLITTSTGNSFQATSPIRSETTADVPAPLSSAPLTAAPISNSSLQMRTRLPDSPSHSLPVLTVSCLPLLVGVWHSDPHCHHHIISVLTECGGELTTPTGVISSPNYPNHYPHSRQCEWKITATSGKKITVTFDDFNIERQTSCLFDYLEV